MGIQGFRRIQHYMTVTSVGLHKYKVVFRYRGLNFTFI